MKENNKIADSPVPNVKMNSEQLFVVVQSHSRTMNVLYLHCITIVYGWNKGLSHTTTQKLTKFDHPYNS